MSVIRSAERRRTETPNAVMTTLASPSQGQAALSVWQVDMRPGQAGPLHGIDAEQVWAVLDGGASVLLGPDTIMVGPGDTIVMPADLPRRVTADPRSGLVAIVMAPAAMRAYVLSTAEQQPPAAVADHDKLVPAWVA
jgi:quercetin dioxygenase-like cupin family protein